MMCILKLITTLANNITLYYNSFYLSAIYVLLLYGISYHENYESSINSYFDYVVVHFKF